MSNVISNIVPQLLAGALPTLRQQAIMPRVVNRSYDSLAREQGDTIDVPIPSAVSARSVTAGVYGTNAYISPTKAQVALNQWKEAPFTLTDKDLEEVMNGTVPMQAGEAVKAIANSVDSYVLALYKGIYNYGGTAGTTPFATNLTAAKTARTWLNNNNAPLENRSVILDADAEGNATFNDYFLKANERGDQGGIIRGELGMKIGMTWYLDQNVPSHTAGTYTVTGAGYPVVKTSLTATQQTMIWAAASTTNTLGGSLVVGDLFTISGHDQPFVVTASVSVTVGANKTLAVSFAPAPGAVVAADATITKIGSHAVNLLLHRDAIALASRPLAQSQVQGVPALFRSVMDPVSGLAIRLEISREHKQTTYSYDALYGATLVRANQAARILG